MDQLYRNVKTGEIKPLPPKVYQAVKKHWEPVEEEFTSVVSENVETVVLEPQLGTGSYTEPAITITAQPEPTLETSQYYPKETLQERYEQLTGQKPDGRWSEKKLIQKIKELKENQ